MDNSFTIIPNTDSNLHVVSLLETANKPIEEWVLLFNQIVGFRCDVYGRSIPVTLCDLSEDYAAETCIVVCNIQTKMWWNISGSTFGEDHGSMINHLRNIAMEIMAEKSDFFERETLYYSKEEFLNAVNSMSDDGYVSLDDGRLLILNSKFQCIGKVDADFIDMNNETED